MRLTYRDNLSRVEADLDSFRESIVAVAVPRALNTLRDQAWTAGKREINNVYQIKGNVIDSPAYTSLKSATATDEEAGITVRGKGFPMSLFNPIPTDRGVVVTIKGRQVLIPHAFMPKKFKQHVFARGSYGGKYGGRATGEAFGRFQFSKTRLPIGEFFSFAPPDCLANQQVRGAMDDRVAEQGAKVLAREIAAAKRGF